MFSALDGQAHVEALAAHIPSDRPSRSPSAKNGADATNGAGKNEDEDGMNDVAGDEDDPTKDDDEEEDEDEDDDEDEDLFVVEAIKKHMVDENGDLKFQVKWEGYDSKADLTWEPEDNLAETATEILEEYLSKFGGRQAVLDATEKAQTKKRRGRPSAGASSNDSKRRRKDQSHPMSTTPPATAVKSWSPPSGSWEDEIEDIDTCEEESNGKLMVYLNWKNGRKTKHETSVIYKKCPQKMLRFYERHVKIIQVKTEEAGQ